MDQCGQESGLQTIKPNVENICPQKDLDAPSIPLRVSEQEANLTGTAHFTDVFSPQERLPNEVLRYIFVLIAEEHGPVMFPFSEGRLPVQLTLSHVCSRWRTLARHTFELWNNIRLIDTCRNYYPCKPLQEWIQLAGNSTVALSLDSTYSWDDDGGFVNIIQDAVSPFKSKILHLDISMDTLMALSKLAHSILPDIRDLHLALTKQDIGSKLSVTPHMLARLHSVTLYDQCYAVNLEALLEQFPLPWSQLRCLTLAFHINHLTPIFAILEQIPKLEYLDIGIFLYHDRPLDSLKKLTMASLRTMTLAVDYGHLDKILPYFTCPSLTNFTLTGSAEWTDETSEIIRQQYNLQRLHKIRWQGCPLPMSSILRDAPLLHTLSLIHHTTTMDGDAITGISNGTLGRHLRKISFNATGIVDAIAEMVETRKRSANMLIENGCSWREAISILREVRVQVDHKWHYILKEKV